MSTDADILIDRLNVASRFSQTTAMYRAFPLVLETLMMGMPHTPRLVRIYGPQSHAYFRFLYSTYTLLHPYPVVSTESSFEVRKHLKSKPRTRSTLSNRMARIFLVLTWVMYLISCAIWGMYMRILWEDMYLYIPALVAAVPSSEMAFDNSVADISKINEILIFTANILTYINVRKMTLLSPLLTCPREDYLLDVDR